MRTKATMPTALAPPSRNATTAMATVNAHSPVHVAANASCARARLGLCAVAENACAAAARRLRSRSTPAGVDHPLRGRSSGALPRTPSGEIGGLYNRPPTP